MNPHKRHMRYRTYGRVRYASRLLDFLAVQAARLSGTGATDVITFTNATNLVNLAAHGLASGDGPYLLSTSGTLPAELDTTTRYWVNAAGAGTLTLHLTEEDAIAGTNIVAFTDDGTGTHNLDLAADEEDVFNALIGGKSAEEIAALASVDNL